MAGWDFWVPFVGGVIGIFLLVQSLLRRRLSRCGNLFAGIQGRIGFSVPLLGSCSGYVSTLPDLSAIRLDFDLSTAATFMDPIRAESDAPEVEEEKAVIAEWLTSKGCEAILSVLLQRSRWTGQITTFCWITLPTGAEYSLFEAETLHESGEGIELKNISIVANKVLNHAASLNLLHEIHQANKASPVPASKEEDRFRRLRIQKGGSMHYFIRVGREEEKFSYGLHVFASAVAPLALMKIMETDEHALMQELLVSFHKCAHIEVDKGLFVPPKNIEAQSLC